MNIISSIVNRESITYNSNLHILWTPIDNKYFTKFIEQLNCTIIDINDMYFGDIFPHMILCNDKVLYYDQIKTLSIRCHLPILVVDHSVKRNIFDNNQLSLLNDLPCAHHVAINNDIYKSWGSCHDQILNYNSNDKDNLSIWKNLLYNISKKVYNI